MATGKVLRVGVFGRVIAPATLVQAGKDSHYLNFSVLVDGLARDKEDRKNRKSGRINCSYLVKGNIAEDPVAVILHNVYNAKTQQGNLGGHAYKSVEVLVEGNMSFTEADRSAYYVALEYCNVTITDNNLVGLYRQLVKGNQHQAQQHQMQQPDPTPQLATVAPNMAPPQAVVQQQPVQASVQQPVAQVQPVVQTPVASVQQPTAQMPQANMLNTNIQDAAAEQERMNLVQNSQVLNQAPAQQETSTSVKQLLETGAAQPNATPNFGNQNNPV